MVGVIERVAALDNFILEAKFTSGVLKRYDVKQLFDEIPAFSEMRDHPEIFQNPSVDCGGYGVVWNDRLDVASEEVWDNGITVE